MDGLLYEALPGRKVVTLAASVLFTLPLVRELCLWTRCIDASKKVASRALSRGLSLQVPPCLAFELTGLWVTGLGSPDWGHRIAVYACARALFAMLRLRHQRLL